MYYLTQLSSRWYRLISFNSVSNRTTSPQDTVQYPLDILSSRVNSLNRLPPSVSSITFGTLLPVRVTNGKFDSFRSMPCAPASRGYAETWTHSIVHVLPEKLTVPQLVKKSRPVTGPECSLPFWNHLFLSVCLKYSFIKPHKSTGNGHNSMICHYDYTFRHIRIKNQQDASSIQNFILSRNSTCFGHLLCPSSGVISCTRGNWHVSCRLCGRCLEESRWFQPDSPDGHSRCPKHVEFRDKIKFWILDASCWLFIRRLSRCTVTW
jgi:hypothetical protein